MNAKCCARLSIKPVRVFALKVLSAIIVKRTAIFDKHYCAFFLIMSLCGEDCWETFNGNHIKNNDFYH